MNVFLLFQLWPLPVPCSSSSLPGEEKSTQQVTGSHKAACSRRVYPAARDFSIP
jgi:hypothetical protein